jgi:hypothetical protein
MLERDAVRPLLPGGAESPRHSDAERDAVTFDLIPLTGSREAIAWTIPP